MNSRLKLKVSEVEITNFLAKNLHLIEDGLTLIKQEYRFNKHERIDLLCRDSNQKLVIIEIKTGTASDNIVGQILRYVIGMKKEYEITNNNNIRAILIVGKKRDFIIPALEHLGFDIQIKHLKKIIPSTYYTKEDIESKKSEYVAFRCPIDLFNLHFKDIERNGMKTQILVNALKTYTPTSKGEFKEVLLNGYIQFNTLFKKISEHFKNGRKTIPINDFIDMCEKNIKYDLIDLINEVLD